MPVRELPRSVGKILPKFEATFSGLASARAPVRIVSHYDADGLCAGGILSGACLRRGIPFRTTIVHGIDAAAINEISANPHEWVLFSDLGSGALDLVERLDGNVVVIDHHKPPRESKSVVQLNCHLWGIDGAFEACASTLSLMMALSLDEGNWDMAGTAIAGAIGDRQHTGGFRGFNAEVLSAAQDGGHIRPRKGLALEGPTLGSALADCNEPFFTGISGDPKGAAGIAEAAGLSPESSLKELDGPELSALASLLVLKLLRQGVPEEFASGVMTDRYWMQGRELDSGELSAVVNACGRLGMEDVGLAAAMGGREALAEAREIRREYRARIMKGMLEIQSKGVQKKPHLQYFYAENAQMAGAFAALVMNYLFPGPQPTISLAREGDSIKISARGTRGLIAKGLDLAAACRKAASATGGDGGGHSIASGATIPLGSEMKFLDALDAIVGGQLAGGAR
jgi:single-stranded DNA-specific DHH superfamily exonuclease